MMKYRMMNTAGTRACTLTTDSNLHFDIRVNTEYGDEAIAYAVCRFLRHAPRVRDSLVSEAVGLALSFRRNRPRYRTIRIPAALLSLEGDEATVRVKVSQGQVTVTSVSLRYEERLAA